MKRYIAETIQLQKDGKEVKPERNQKLTIPLELEDTLNENQQLAEAFKQLTKGKQREYANYIYEAKREATRQNRFGKDKSIKKKTYDKSTRNKKGSRFQESFSFLI